MIETGALTIDRDGLKTLFPPLPERTNKGDRGRVLAVCGSFDPCGLSMSGAAYFAAKAAYRCGAGIVEIFAPRENYLSLVPLVPEAVFSHTPDCRSRVVPPAKAVRSTVILVLS